MNRPTVGDVYAWLDSIAPFETAEGFDNVGLLIGEKSAPVTKAIFTLDLSEKTVDEAIAFGAELIITHHPIIFSPLRRIHYDTPFGRMLVKLTGAGISVIAAHTNWDAAQGGVNDVLAGLFGLSSVENFGGVGRMGTCTDCSPDEFARRVKKALGITAVQLESSGVLVNKVAVVGGSGGDFVGAAAAAGCQMLVTGECKHHEALLARRLGISVISAGHYETENPSMYYLASALSAALGGKAECLLFEGSMPIFRTV